MDGIIGFLLLLALFVVLGAIFGWVAFFRTSRLDEAYQRLAADYKKLKQQVREQSSTSQQTVDKTNQTLKHSPSSMSDKPNPERLATKAVTQPTATASTKQTAPKTTQVPSTSAKPTSTTPPKKTSRQPKPQADWQRSLVENWMIWLGGISVGLAGIFMVKYSIDAGMLGPKTQISMAIITGIVLHIAAEWLRRRNKGSDPVFASLAGGASITLYAALLAALHVYHLVEPGTIFIALAIVSLFTMGMALLHGPVLAILGLIGAYVVPILVSTGSGNMVAALIYTLIISASALLLTRYVFRNWLWWSIIAGSLGWWALSLTTNQADDFRAIYLAILAWALLAIPYFDWLLSGKRDSNEHQTLTPTISIASRSFSVLQLVLSLILLAWGISMYAEGYGALRFALWSPLIIVSFFAAQGRKQLCLLPWLALVIQWFVWFAIGFEQQTGHAAYQFRALPDNLTQHFLTFAGLSALLYSGFAVWQWLRQGFSHPRASLALLAPLIWLSLSYLQVHGHTQSLYWGSVALGIGLSYALIAGLRLKRSSTDDVALWFTLSAHFAYSLAAVLFFREAMLSLALAAQMVSLAWLTKRYSFPWLQLLLKVVVSAVVIRLTLNPWLADYPTDIHWSIYTYGGSTAFAFLASRLCSDGGKIKLWLEAASLHLLVLTLGTELRYWLYDGAIFSEQYHLTEAAINTSLWAGLSLVYYRRATISDQLASFYRLCSNILLILASASYVIAVIPKNPWWNSNVISDTPIFNLLLLAYGAPIILALLVALYHQPKSRSFAFKVSGFALFLFITLEIRHLWKGSDMLLTYSTGHGELYTYSVVWMLLAIAAVLFGANWQNKLLNKTGMALLAVVIGKIFLIDMSGLDGLWRVASFMGLGLALLGLAWLYRRVTTDTDNNTSS
ncbi:DUF2339 domain-containing protein [Kangiella marina]|uniref:DUF2339 domain-containing protein n=1 Tax=Kangiella marina TaxID=1079178 RepID=A0ABP8IJD8_9GAMM